MKEFEIKVKKEEEVPVLDPQGKPVLDDKGKPKKDKKTEEIPVQISTIKVQKGKGAGTEYWAPKKVSTFNLEFLLSLFTETELVDKLFRPKFKQFCAVITNEAAYDAGRRTAADVKEAAKEGKKIIESPIQDEEKFIDGYTRMFSTLSARGESRVGLTRAQNELLGEFTDLDENAEDYQERALAIMAKVRKIRAALAEKVTEDEEETPADVKVAA